MKISRFISIAAALCLLFTGCGGKEPEPAMAPVGEVSIRDAVTSSDPQAALDEIYAALPDVRTEPLTSGRFSDLFAGLEGRVKNHYGLLSDATAGLADVIIIEPAATANSTENGGNGSKSNRDYVRDALRKYQDDRIHEFENYDILDSFTIATGAEVFDQGDFVILLMLPDNETAREVVDKHIPL